ncbi:MAG: hypothetical protein PHU81_01915 [Acidobacteriota bacterium]|nr:hypothetical protein [Acidobacteriota bacterium]
MSDQDQKVNAFPADEPVLKEDEIFSGLGPARGSLLFLGRYTLKEVMSVLAKKSFFREARKRNLWPLAYRLDSSDCPVQRLLIFWEKRDPDRIIVDLKLKESEVRFLAPEKHGFKLPPQHSLLFEWLTLQNPRMSFSGQHGPLPGQTRPGLSLSKKILEIFLYLSKLIDLDALVAFPAYFHNALLFSRYLHFVDPVKEGEIKAIRRQFNHVSFRRLAWAVYLGCLEREEGQIYDWQAEEQLYPLSEPLKDYINSRVYKEITRHVEKTSGFKLNLALLKEKSQKQGILY